MKGVCILCVLFLLLVLPCVVGIGVSLPQWVIYDEGSVYFSVMTVIVENPADYQWNDMIIVTDDSNSGRLFCRGHVLSAAPNFTVVAYMRDMVERRISFPVELRVDWFCCRSFSIPMSVYVLYNTTEGFMISTGISGLAAVNDLRHVSVSEFRFLLLAVVPLCAIKLYSSRSFFRRG